MTGCNTREENAADLAHEEKEGHTIHLEVSPRERDTIIAAVRLWQWQREGGFRISSTDRAHMLREIAENGREGPGAMLSPAEIDELIEERVN